MMLAEDLVLQILFIQLPASVYIIAEGNIKRRYESPFVDTGTVEENKPACPSSEESDGDSNTNFNNDDGDADYSPPAVSRRSRRRSRRHCENVGDGPQKRKSTCSPRVTAKRKQIKVEIVEQSDSDHDSNDNETPLNLEDSCLTQPGPSGGMITILDSIDSGRLAKLTDEAIRNSKQEKPKVTRPAQRNSMSLLQKMEIIRLADKGLKQTQISRMLNVKKSTVCSQLAQREKIEEAFNAGCPAMKKKLRKGPYDDVNLALYAWYQKVTSQNLFVNSRVLLTMAENIAKELGRTDFKGSPSWMEGFKQRYNIRFTLNQYKPRKNSNKTKQESAGLHDSNLSEADEAQQSDASGVIDDDGGLNKPSDPRTQDWLTHTWSKLRIKNSKTQEMYQERDIFFAEELGILYRMTPKQAWQFRHNDATTIPDFTIADERITVLLCANADCSEKRRLLIIGKSNSGMTNNSPADYIVAKDPSNWITKSAFRHWLKTWNTSLESEKRKVILLLNSSPIHTLDAKTGVPNVKVVNIPTHHTKLLHPVHCGISKSFRSRYRRILLEKIVSGAHPETLDSQLAAFMLSTAWTEVPDQLIRGAFVQTGLISSSEVLTSSDEFDCANLLAKAAELGYAVSPSKWSFLVSISFF